MPDMTEEEYDAFDELWTNNPPKVSGCGKKLLQWKVKENG